MGARAVWISRRAGHTAPGVVLACGLMGDSADLLFDSDCARHDLDLAPCEPLSLAESHSKQQQVVKEMMLESQPKVHTRDLETGWRFPPWLSARHMVCASQDWRTPAQIRHDEEMEKRVRAVDSQSPFPS